MTDAELEQFLKNINAVGRALTPAETLADKLVSAHLENDNPLEKAEAVRALVLDGKTEQNAAIYMYLTALNNKCMDGSYNRQDAQVMNAVVRNLAYKLINHQPLQEQSQAMEVQYQR